MPALLSESLQTVPLANANKPAAALLILATRLLILGEPTVSPDGWREVSPGVQYLVPAPYRGLAVRRSNPTAGNTVGEMDPAKLAGADLANSAPGGLSS
jgi:hypothetical protein